MRKLKSMALELMGDQNFDCLAMGVIDFSKERFETFEIGPYSWFDLASLTKPLTLGSFALLYPQLMDDEILMLMEHRAGLPEGGLLSADSWRQQMASYPIKASPTLYSDFSPLRAQVEIEKKCKGPLYPMVQVVWGKKVIHWKKLKEKEKAAPSGFRQGRPIQGIVHDPKAWVLDEVALAGLFATADGLCQCLLNLNSKGLLDFMSKAFKRPKIERFLYAWDTISNSETTLAGKGCGPHTFGHLGFTGTSIWIDADKNLGYVLLTNATQNYWFDKTKTNALRRQLGQAVWQGIANF